ncbi:MAG: alpha/beta hydrolase [Clostridia bacterium]|nr:alpha/beta hydrolase [Clostridia bacterium]
MQTLLAFILSIGLMFNTMFGLLSEKYKVYENIRYGDAERDLVTIYVPYSAAGREYNGVILYIHGGSWTGGEKEDMAPLCEKLAGKGYITATMSYSLCSDDTFGDITVYTMLDEIGMCIEALKAFSDEKGLNITKVAPSGYSAGGHISMLYSYTRADSCPLELSFTANRVGPADMTTAAWGDTAYRLTQQLTGVKITDEMRRNGEADRLCRDISPVSYVNKNTVPSLFAYAGNDLLVPKGNREAMVNVFTETFGENSDHYKYVFYPLSGHGLLLDPVSEECYYNSLYDFCETYFGY